MNDVPAEVTGLIRYTDRSTSKPKDGQALRSRLLERASKYLKGLLHKVQWMSCNPILSGFGKSIESHSGDYGSIFSFQRHQSGATNCRYDIMQQTPKIRLVDAA